jgi:dipeptidase D
MSDALAGLEPRSLWNHFASIAAVPRPSKHEERIAAWVRELATEHGFEVQTDAVGNLVIDVPASPGREQAPTVVIQGHLDMVGEKNRDVSHDFMKDPIRPRVDGEWVRATGTTLGADNGLGVAAALAVATDAAVKHGPLQLLFTLDEETGLTGAAGLDASLIHGRILLNLDSEEDGVIYVGCAGGADSHLFLEPARTAAPDGAVAWRLAASGLQGGHSGMNIVENRGNALKLIARTLHALKKEGVDHGLAGIAGGRMHNAIPREAEATLLLSPAAAERAAGVVACALAGFREELAGIDDGVELVLEQADGPAEDPFSTADRDRLVRLLLVLPHGVLAMSQDIEGLVETSSNLAAVTQEGSRLRIVTSSRSSVAPALASVMSSIAAAGALAGAEVETHDGYPGWKPDLESKALAVVRDVYAEIWQRQPEVTAVHAGLECGLLGEKIEGLDMVSFGPRIEGAHSPDERAHIESTARFWQALVRVLDRLSS